jgi:mRNA interferase RelE/StbE
MYNVEFTKAGVKDLEKLPKQVQEQIIAKLERARIRPEHYFERLVGDTSYKLRIGEYRVIADILHGKLVILVIEVGHRGNIYKTR